MNFYKHHLGDFDGAAMHLNWTQYTAYLRLVHTYYRRELPIPKDTSEACRLVRAENPAQRKAVKEVLSEFFQLLDDGWHNKRCDEEIAAYKAQAATNKRIAHQRIANQSFNESSHESSTNRPPNHKPEPARV